MFVLLGEQTAFAQGTPSLIPAEGVAGCDFLGGEISASCIPDYIAYVIKFIFGFVGAICLITIMYAGYEIALSSLSGGDRSSGMQRLTWAIIGLIICALAFFLIDFVISSIAGL